MRKQLSTRTTPQNDVLEAWLEAVSSHLAVRRNDNRGSSRPGRNRERERARREARRLFAEYYREVAVANARAA